MLEEQARARAASSTEPGDDAGADELDNAIIPPPFPEYADNPVEFCRDILGFTPWAAALPGKHGQLDILRALPAHKSIAVRSGHKVGKSTVAAAIALWWYCTRPLARCVLTGPTSRQVKRVIWREVRRLFRIATRRARVKGKTIGGEAPKDPATGIQSDDGREIFGFTTDDPDAFSGISGPNVMYIADEAPGVSDEIFEAIEGNRAGGAYLILLGNPTKTSGKFFDAFHRARSLWKLLHISSEDTPANDNAIPGLATRAWVEERQRDWGEDSPIYQMRVRGNFPAQASNAVIGLSLLEAALERWLDTLDNGAPAVPFEGPLRIGVDPARFGDDETAIQPVRGYRTYGPAEAARDGLQLSLRSMDTVEVAGKVLEVARKLRRPGEGPPLVCVDTIGLGAGVYDQLLRHPDDVIAVSVDSSRVADNEEDYHNLRAQLYFGVRDWLRDGGAVHADPVLEGEIVAPLYTFDSRNRYQVESKDDIRKRLKRSPNRLDALQLAVYRPPMTEVEQYPRQAGSRWDGYEGRGFG